MYSIFAFLTRQEQPLLTDIRNTDSLKAVRNEFDTVIVGYLDKADQVTRERFAAIAEELRDDYVFGTSNNEALCIDEGVSVPSIVVYSTVADSKSVLPNPSSMEAIQVFVKTATTPPIMEILPETHDRILSVRCNI